MRLVSRLVWVLALAVFPIGGCNEVTTPTTARLTLTVSGWDAEAESQLPLEGVMLCQNNTANCALSGANGEVAIELPIGEETSYTVDKEGYASWLVPQVLGPEGAEYPFINLTHQWMTEQHARVNSPYPMRGTGTLLLRLFPPFEGATFTLVDATGKAYYFDEEENWDLDLAATTADGRGGFVEVSPGVFQVTLGGSAQRCVPDLAWPGDVENSISFPVRERYATFSSVRCPLPP